MHSCVPVVLKREENVLRFQYTVYVLPSRKMHVCVPVVLKREENVFNGPVHSLSFSQLQNARLPFWKRR